MAKVKALVIVGYGLNCEAETCYAFERAGARADQVHLSDLIAKRRKLEEFHLLALIGGFSFGDHIAGGKVFANRFACKLREQISAFIAAGKLVIGICNGFQTLVKLGLLPGIDNDYETQRVTLGANECGVFRDAWVRVKVDEGSCCVFTKGIDAMDLPVRHGEGQFYVQEDSVLERMKRQGQIALRYAHPESGEPTQEFPHNPNGSVNAVAGICDPTGRIFGLMPHPEAYNSPFNHPQWPLWKLEGRLPEEGEGIRIFRNAVEYLEESGL